MTEIKQISELVNVTNESADALEWVVGAKGGRPEEVSFKMVPETWLTGIAYDVGDCSERVQPLTEHEDTAMNMK